jgi:hypothetical protein
MILPVPRRVAALTRVDSVAAGATGTVAMDWEAPAGRPDYDPNAADDTAALTLN